MVLPVPFSCPAPPLSFLCALGMMKEGVHCSGREQGWNVLLGIVSIASEERWEEQQGTVKKHVTQQYTRSCTHSLNQLANAKHMHTLVLPLPSPLSLYPPWGHSHLSVKGQLHLGVPAVYCKVLLTTQVHTHTHIMYTCM